MSFVDASMPTNASVPDRSTAGSVTVHAVREYVSSLTAQLAVMARDVGDEELAVALDRVADQAYKLTV